MPPMVLVVGGFSLNGHPARGWVRFTPSRLWIIEQGTAWACLAPTITLDVHGEFMALLTPTDSDPVPWHYTVETGAGSWRIAPKGTKKAHLKDLVTP